MSVKTIPFREGQERRVAGDVPDRHGPDARNLDAIQMGRGQRPEAVEQGAAGQRHSQSKQLAAG
jgi:hypothetical protein